MEKEVYNSDGAETIDVGHGNECMAGATGNETSASPGTVAGPSTGPATGPATTGSGPATATGNEDNFSDIDDKEDNVCHDEDTPENYDSEEGQNQCDPTYKPKKIQEEIEDRYNLVVSNDQCRKAKGKALAAVQEEHDLRFSKIKDYKQHISE
ncbi:unnamed protein product [Arabis nemorensis]|uniref:Uncharacterized protein n=1 Tax=Arabis nemorensis TaxID=586526 RepID=A0A565C2N7_9BRAS|nr:unnamed protein product [Arabis nemorensis]